MAKVISVREAGNLVYGMPKPTRRDVPDYIKEVRTLGSRDGGVKIPVLDDSSSLIGLMLGRNLDLFQLILPTLDVGFTYTQTFPILPPVLFGNVDGLLGAQLQLGFGYDTNGILKYSKTGDPADLFDGFYIDDQLSGGKDLAEAVVFGAIYVTAGLPRIPEFPGINYAAEAGGGIKATVNFNLNDPNNDGKVRANELLELLKKGPECVFDIQGEVVAKLFAKLKMTISAGFTSRTIADIYREFVDVTLLEFAHTCSGKQLKLGEVNGDGVLKLLVGDSQKHNQGVDEDFSLETGDTDNVIIVSGAGASQSFSGVRRVEADFGNGKNKLRISNAIKVPVKAIGGDDSDVFIAGGGAAEFIGLGGNDILVGGSADDVLDGGSGDDNLSGNGGNDILFGGSGQDRLQGHSGGDVLIGGEGDDRLDGGEGNDAILGDGPNSGPRSLLRGYVPGQRTKSSFGNPDENAGADIINGGVGIDLVFGGKGDDTISGDQGNDVVFGGDGSDQLRGGTGDDLLDGGTDDDEILGELGSDVLIGGVGSDSLYAFIRNLDGSADYRDPDKHVMVGDTPVMVLTFHFCSLTNGRCLAVVPFRHLRMLGSIEFTGRTAMISWTREGPTT